MIFTSSLWTDGFTQRVKQGLLQLGYYSMTKVKKQAKNQVFMRLSTSARGSITWRPQVVQCRPISAPSLVTRHA